MKKNLKIVSAAAAALLAVAPVAGVAVSQGANIVSAADNGGAVHEISLNNAKKAVKGDITLNSHLVANTYPRETQIDNTTGKVTYSNWDGKVSGTIGATINGQTEDFLANLFPDGKIPVTGYDQVQLYTKSGSTYTRQTNVNDLEPGTKYYVQVLDATFNLGNANANKKNLVLKGANDVKVWKNGAWHTSTKVSTDRNGVTEPVSILVPIYPNDITNARSVSFFDKVSGNEVTSGTLNMTAGATHQLNVQQVYSAFVQKYEAHQLEGTTNSKADLTTTVNDIQDQLTKAGIKVDDQGFFTAPEHFSFTVNAKSRVNTATASMNVNVNVANGVHTNTPDEYAHTTRVWNKKASYIYNANHEKQGFGYMYKIGSGHNVVAENGQPKEYHLANGFTAYKLADGHYKGNYVDVRNFSTSRVESNVKVVTTRSRVFTNTGKVVGKHNYVNSGVRVKVSGTKTIKGHKMYRIATNRYIKAANVRNA